MSPTTRYVCELRHVLEKTLQGTSLAFGFKIREPQRCLTHNVAMTFGMRAAHSKTEFSVPIKVILQRWCFVELRFLIAGRMCFL